ncbi:hypothetical protein HDV00_010292 [Rhizophlyctis rosea]|nr:hypothetical protein HDV00_010292 [Rhizophlyctis rosea]
MPHKPIKKTPTPLIIPLKSKRIAERSSRLKSPDLEHPDTSHPSPHPTSTPTIETASSPTSSSSPCPSPTPPTKWDAKYDRKRKPRHNLKLPSAHRTRFTCPFEDFLAALLTRLEHTALPPPFPPKILSAAHTLAPKGSNWTVWVKDETQRKFLEAKEVYAPEATHGEFVECLLNLGEDGRWDWGVRRGKEVGKKEREGVVGFGEGQQVKVGFVGAHEVAGAAEAADGGYSSSSDDGDSMDEDESSESDGKQEAISKAGKKTVSTADTAKGARG